MAVAAACATTPPPQAPRGDDDLPIVLAHGLAGFRSVSTVDYFYRVPAALRADGRRVFVTTVPPWGSVPVRAEHLARQLDMILRRTHAPRLHVIAHSMGGLDARYAISKLGFGGRIASLTTVGTPHRGTVVADGYGALNFGPTHFIQDFGADVWSRTVNGIEKGSDTQGLAKDLSARFAAVFNAEVRDDPRVRYYSFAGRTLGASGTGICDEAEWPNPDETDIAPPALVTTAVLLSGLDPRDPIPNDGLVQVRSARWGIFMGCLPADHMKEVGHPVLIASFPGRWHHVDFYRRWAGELVTGKARTYGAHGSWSDTPASR